MDAFSLQPDHDASSEHPSVLEGWTEKLEQSLEGRLPDFWTSIEQSLDADTQIEPVTDEELQAYCDGELLSEEQVRIDKQLALQPQLAQELGRLQEVRLALQSFHHRLEVSCSFDQAQQVTQQLDHSAERQTDWASVDTNLSLAQAEQLSAYMDGELSPEGLKEVFREPSPVIDTTYQQWRVLSDRLSHHHRSLLAQVPELDEVSIKRLSQTVDWPQQTQVKPSVKERSSVIRLSTWAQSAVAACLGVLVTVGLIQWTEGPSVDDSTVSSVPSVAVATPQTVAIRPVSSQPLSVSTYHPNGDLIPLEDERVPFPCQFKAMPSAEAYLRGLQHREYEATEAFYLYEL